ncbi:hypothetical protein HG264_03910 [Pseudomonas sp. gcc21]|uniref:hypothetical protein n=1 Tax=Pseudomonas sp. gcc21 TaxID=2726989 RepID=UPI0014527CC9|nr:hypothetical protein [Pseudomonas sp. gcc21]QJD58117.1 hypothetical protein HG264_03910 [Pseudomonas sp. gcc21]
MNQPYKSRQRWLMERWLAKRRKTLVKRWEALQKQLKPADWSARCARMLAIPDTEVSGWKPRAGSSSDELGLLMQVLPLHQRRWLASLLDAPSAGPNTLIEAIERLQLDWRVRLDPLHSHREYAAQLVVLTRQLDLKPAAESAYLENEQKIFPAIDELLFESLPLRLRTIMLERYQPGSGNYVVWWQTQLLARAGEPGFTLNGLGEHDWPELPAAWLALGWLCGLRLIGGSAP